MGQVLEDIRQMAELACALRRFASEARGHGYMTKLQSAASDLEARVNNLMQTEFDDELGETAPDTFQS